MKRRLVLVLLLVLTLPSVCIAGDLQESRLDRGLRSTEAYSYQLLQKARENRPEALQLLTEAAKESPNLPDVYFALAKTGFSLSSSGMFASINNIIKGISAYSANFWSAFTLAGSVFFSIIISFAGVIAIIVMTRFPSDMRLFAHNLAETKQLLLVLGLLIIISAISPLFFLAGLLVVFGIYMKRLDRTVVYLFLVFLVFSPLFFTAASLFLQVQSSPRMKAIVAVNESKDNAYALATLKNSDDYAALFSYALALKREGHYNEAVSAYQRLLQRKPDPKVYVNLGNCFVGLKNMEEALASYLKASELKPLASAYYNLSQISRETLDYEKGNEYFARALAINREAVSDYRLIYSRNPNRIVVDETLSYAALWGLALGQTIHASTLGISVLPAFMLSGMAVLLIILFFFLLSGMRNKAYRCNRCGAILCPQCEKTLIRGKMCQTCYASFIKPDQLVAKERVTKLLSIYEHQKKRRNIMKIFAFLVPGIAQLYAGKIAGGVFFLWPFLFLLSLPFTNMLFSRGGTIFAHSFFTWAAVFLAALIYIVSNMITRQRIIKGWL